MRYLDIMNLQEQYFKNNSGLTFEKASYYGDFN